MELTEHTDTGNEHYVSKYQDKQIMIDNNITPKANNNNMTFNRLEHEKNVVRRALLSADTLIFCL